MALSWQGPHERSILRKASAFLLFIFAILFVCSGRTFLFANPSYLQMLELETESDQFHQSEQAGGSSTNTGTSAPSEHPPSSKPPHPSSPTAPSIATSPPTPAPAPSSSDGNLPEGLQGLQICPIKPIPADDPFLSRALPKNIARTALPSRTTSTTRTIPIQIGVLGGSYSQGVSCNQRPVDQVFQCEMNLCFPCSWPGRLQTLLDEYFGEKKFNVINLSVAASCSGCMAPVLANKLSGPSIEGGKLDILIHDLSVNDANTKRENTRAPAGKDPRYVILQSVEEIVRRVLDCDNDLVDPPMVWMTQGPPIAWNDKGPPSSYPVYKNVAANYNLPYLDLNEFSTRQEIKSYHWPHPSWTAHAVHAALVFKYISSMFCANMVGDGEEKHYTCEPPMTSDEEREKFLSCDVLTTYMSGADPENWDVGAVGPGWGLNHDDVPNRPDKTGWLFQYRPDAGLPATSTITFNNVVVTGSNGNRIIVGYLHTYEGYDKVQCSVDGGESKTIDPIWSARVSLVDWAGLPTTVGSHSVTCTVDLSPESGRDLSKPFNFKILAITSC